jgi:hypothetical protein
MSVDVRVVARGIEALRRVRSEVWRRCGRIVRLCSSSARIHYLNIHLTYRAHTSRSLLLGQTPHLQRDLHQCPRYTPHEDDAAECVVDQRLEMSFSRCYTLVSFLFMHVEKKTYFQLLSQASH